MYRQHHVGGRIRFALTMPPACHNHLVGCFYGWPHDQLGCAKFYVWRVWRYCLVRRLVPRINLPVLHAP